MAGILDTPQRLDQILSDVRIILEYVTAIDRRTHHMATSIVTRDQFDAALTDAVTKITTSISDLEAKIAAGTVTTPEDFSAELATLKGVVSTAVGADPGAASVAPDPTAAS